MRRRLLVNWLLARWTSLLPTTERQIFFVIDIAITSSFAKNPVIRGFPAGRG
jgi:hypothetical protein